MEKEMANINSLKNAIDKLNSIDPPTRKKRNSFRNALEKHIPEIRKQMERGFTLEQIYNFLCSELDMPITMNTFRNYMQTIDQK